jgi:transposase
MIVYLPEAVRASLTCRDCLCRDRKPHYPSDLTDAQWEVLRPQAEQVMDLLRRAAGRPMIHDTRAMLDAIFYVDRQGIEWRALPVDFPPWDGVYAFYQRWNERGMPQLLTERLRSKLRERVGRDRQPRAAIIDSQTVKAADTVAAASRGFDSGKKINGRKRHIAVDTMGLPLAVVVTAASLNDRTGARLLLIRLLDFCTRLCLIWADDGYNGTPIIKWFRGAAAISFQVIKRTEPHRFQVLPRRWVVERTFGWLLRYRRLVRDYERRPEHHEAMIYWATVHLMTRRLARTTHGQPQPKTRWGQPRPQPQPAPTPT